MEKNVDTKSGQWYSESLDAIVHIKTFIIRN